MSHKTVSIPNISCGHCVATIEREIGALDGVSQARADQERKELTVEWDEQTTDWAAVSDRLTAIHYPASD